MTTRNSSNEQNAQNARGVQDGRGVQDLQDTQAVGEAQGTQGELDALDSELERQEEKQEEKPLQDLRSLVEQVFGGPDPNVLSEVLGENDPAFSQDETDFDVILGSSQASNAENIDEQRILTAQAEVQLVDLTQALEARAGEHNFDPSLTRMQKTLSILGDPQNAYPAIHVAGTNGKTSTSRVAESLLRELGLRVGRYTSPHLQSITERINLDGRQLSAPEFLAAWQDIAPYVAMVDATEQEQGKQPISYFEALTLMAFAAFADYPVDVAVLECGMGGRWDATNLVDAKIAVITSISRDHEEYLGSSLLEIAAEKAEIIKPKSIAVIMRQDEAVLDLLLKKCQAQDALARVEGVDWQILRRDVGVGGQMITVRTPAAVYEDIFVPLNGEFQAHNAAAALVAVEALLGGRVLPAEVVERGIGAATSPGRLEVVRTSPTIIVDGAHNPAGVAALVRTLPETFQLGYMVGIFACLGDKRVEEMLSLAEPVFDDLVVTTLPNSRALPVDDLSTVAADVFGSDRVHTADTLEEAIDKAALLADSVSDPTLSRGIVAFGSLYLVGAIKILLGR